MALRLHRRIRLAPGFALNLNKTGASLSMGVRGLHTTFGRRSSTTVGIPGSGVSYTLRQHAARAHRTPVPWLGLAVLAFIAWRLFH